MVVKLDTKSRTILAIAAGVAGGTWCAVLGFPWLLRVLVALGATLPIWVMSRGVLRESARDDERMHLVEAAPSEAPDGSVAPERLADVFPLDRMRIARSRRNDRPEAGRLTG